MPAVRYYRRIAKCKQGYWTHNRVYVIDTSDKKTMADDNVRRKPCVDYRHPQSGHKIWDEVTRQEYIEWYNEASQKLHNNTTITTTDKNEVDDFLFFKDGIYRYTGPECKGFTTGNLYQCTDGYMYGADGKRIEACNLISKYWKFQLESQFKHGEGWYRCTQINSVFDPFTCSKLYKIRIPRDGGLQKMWTRNDKNNVQTVPLENFKWEFVAAAGQLAPKLCEEAQMSKDKFGYFRRVQESNANSFTVGYIYKVDKHTNSVINDRGNRETFGTSHMDPNCNEYWENSTEVEYDQQQRNDNVRGQYKYFERATPSAHIPVGDVVRVELESREYYAPNVDKRGRATKTMILGNSDHWNEISYSSFYNRVVDHMINGILLDPPTDGFVMNPQPKEEPPMGNPTKVESVVMIDGERADSVSDDRVIQAIKNEQESIKSLREVESDSKYIAAKIKLHEKSIKDLTALLDKRAVK